MGVGEGGDRGAVRRFEGEERERRDSKKYKRSHESRSDEGIYLLMAYLVVNREVVFPERRPGCSLAVDFLALGWGCGLRRPGRQVREN